VELGNIYHQWGVLRTYTCWDVLERAWIVENPEIYRYALVGTKGEQPLLDPLLAWPQNEDLGVSDR